MVYNKKLENFITFEGMDGSGKTTAIQEVKKKLEENGYEVILTREPGGTALGEKLREIVKHEEMCLSTEIALMNAIRIEHLHKVIIPALNEGKIVLCDRYVDSTFVYQILAAEDQRIKEEKIFNAQDNEIIRRELEFKTIELMRNFNIALPEKTFFLDVPVDTSLMRRNKRNEATDKFENKTYKDLEKIRNAYLTLIQEDEKNKQDRFIVIDANKTQEEVLESTLSEIERLYPEMNKRNKRTIS